ncbi:Threonine/homoserine/homoserine lactone efflux protein [Desulfocicer vacuolatum DSM 3385]|uniref:Threonine/homoserine/homoserine lactone efflux protein n=1 Tax=Desulfocicer vacuolatum DSM 3385 TaxID=1121400 RepID=A0A1W2DTT9_9BACT|nr:LysE family translocator [Desulfocicer vacuolatum]SMD00807.1 Threonine/homoserine/homoserine lactone efflux protein [Desulfocicer vacuolatum DSM 3385]
MISFEIILTFFAAAILLALAPGPDNIFVLTQSTLRGRWAGVAVTMGLCTGLVFHSSAVALGVAAIFQTSVLAFSALKFAGAGYLIYLAWQAFRASAQKFSGGSMETMSFKKLYGRGIIMNITNPKVSIFFLAFLPQFVVPSAGSIPLQILMLGGIFIFATLIVFGSIAMVAGYLGERMNQSPGMQKILNRVAGTVFLGLALKLVTTRQ